MSICICFLAHPATQSRGGLLGILAVFVFLLTIIQNKRFLGRCAIAALILYQVAGISGRVSGGALRKVSMLQPWEGFMLGKPPLAWLTITRLREFIDNLLELLFLFTPLGWRKSRRSLNLVWRIGRTDGTHYLRHCHCDAG